MIELAVGIAPTLEMGLSAEGGVVALGDVFAVRVEELSIFFPLTEFPFRVYFWVAYPCAFVVFLGAFGVATWGVIVGFAFLVDDGLREPCVEVPVLDYVLEHRREVQWARVEWIVVQPSRNSGHASLLCRVPLRPGVGLDG